jgi:hypothetical protein
MQRCQRGLVLQQGTIREVDLQDPRQQALLARLDMPREKKQFDFERIRQQSRESHFEFEFRNSADDPEEGPEDRQPRLHLSAYLSQLDERYLAFLAVACCAI